MRDTIKQLQPDVHESATQLYSALDVGRLSRVELGGYKLEGLIFATSEIDRKGIHRVLDQLMDRLDRAVEEAMDERGRRP